MHIYSIYSGTVIFYARPPTDVKKFSTTHAMDIENANGRNQWTKDMKYNNKII
jgi:hypothetical protein